MRENTCIHEGTCYPVHHLCATFDDDLDAGDAVRELQLSGFSDMEWFHGAEAYATIQQRRVHQPMMVRVWRAVRNVGTEGDLHRLFLRMLREGGSMVIAAAYGDSRVEEARAVVASHHASSVWYLGSWAMERLPTTVMP